MSENITIVNVQETSTTDLVIDQPTVVVTHDLPSKTTSPIERSYTFRVQSKFTWVHIVSSGFSCTESAHVSLETVHARANLVHSISAGHDADITSTVLIEHAAESTHSSFLAHHLAHDNAFIRSTGDIHIQSNAPNSTAEEDMRTLLMSPTAHALPMPILRVDNNNVQSRHAAAAHGVLPRHLFALQARGLSHHQALQLMAQGHVSPILEALEPFAPTVADQFRNMVAVQTDLS